MYLNCNQISFCLAIFVHQTAVFGGLSIVSIRFTCMYGLIDLLFQLRPVIILAWPTPINQSIHPSIVADQQTADSFWWMRTSSSEQNWPQTPGQGDI